MSYAIDANLLLYAANSSAAENAAAVGFLERCAAGPEVLCLAWPTVTSFLRIATHPGVFPTPLTWSEAVEQVDALLALPQTRLLGELLDGFWNVLRDVGAPIVPRGNLIPDVHLAAILRQNGVTTLYTRDQDFRRFPFLEVRDPLAP